MSLSGILQSGVLKKEASVPVSQRKTGAYLDFTIPPQDASKKLSLMILKDELPDLIVATDKNVINQLIRSGKVWSLQDFFELTARIPIC